MAQLSNDCFSQNEPLIRVDKALELIAQQTRRVTESKTVPLQEALGRILLEDVTSSISVPRHDNSAVDGYAVFFEDLHPTLETSLPIAGRAAAGHPFKGIAQRGTAIRIFTGAPMPPGPDTVMMQEDCRVEGDVVIITPGIKRGSNRRQAGEDIEAGRVVLNAGQRLRPQDLGQAAAVGRRELEVAEPLRVALFSTGDELCEPGEDLPAGGIYDSNRFTVAALLQGLGCEVTDLGILKDRSQEIRLAFMQAAVDHDMIITSGGVSVGEEDHVKEAVESLGNLHFWRLAIKPGRPIALGQVARLPFVGLPGNPVAVMVTFLNIVRPLILRLMGGTELRPRHFKVEAGFDYRKKLERREWVRARLVQDAQGNLTAAKFPREGAGILTSMVESDGLIELPEEMKQLEPGMLVDFLPYSEVLT